MSKPEPAIVLLSGGIDSATTLAIAIAEGYETYALSFDYGQRHQIETEAARRVAKSLGIKEHRIAKIDLRVFGGSALTDHVAVPRRVTETSCPLSNCSTTIALDAISGARTRAALARS